MNHETIVKLVELQMEQFDNTRDTKTKINIALWTFLAATAAFAVAHDHARLVSCSLVLVVVAFATLAALHIAWMVGIQKSLDFDKEAWIKYREMLDKGDSAKLPILQQPSMKYKWVVIESGVTIVFISLALLAIIV